MNLLDKTASIINDMMPGFRFTTPEVGTTVYGRKYSSLMTIRAYLNTASKFGVIKSRGYDSWEKCLMSAPVALADIPTSELVAELARRTAEWEEYRSKYARELAKTVNGRDALRLDIESKAYDDMTGD